MSSYEDKQFVKCRHQTAKLEFESGSCGVGDSYVILINDKIIARSYDPGTAWFKAKQYVLNS